jgi:hypothetical protein
MDEIRVMAPIIGFAVGVGLWRRERRRGGVGLMVASVVATLLLAGFGYMRPLVGLIAATGLVGGVIVDEEGRRVLALVSVTVGFFALMIAYFYT